MKSRERSCGNKIRHTEAQARAMIKTLRRRDQRAFKRIHSMKAYPCLFCGGWHVGHQAPPRRTAYKRVKRISYFPAIEELE